MIATSTGKVSQKNQISLPSRAREILGIGAGDRLLVDVQDGMLILLPQPEDYVSALAGLHREVWLGVDVATYINEERDSWPIAPQNDSNEK